MPGDRQHTRGFEEFHVRSTIYREVKTPTALMPIEAQPQKAGVFLKS
jgi:hypothetical protein